MSAVPVGAKSPLLLYVNIPFCNSKCHFCDWVVQVPIGDLRLGPESEGRRGHLDALRTQIEAQAPALNERYRPEVMYWGGGTASILSLDEIEKLYASVADNFPMDGIVEATIESSPESLDPEKLKLFREIGFNRISIGVQAFDNDRLRMIGRAHSADVAESSVRLAREAGFENINIDLIVGFPDQTLAEVEETVRKAVTLPINHFSVYAYRASEGTVLRRRLDRENAKTDLRNQLNAYRLATSILAEHGHHEYSFGYFGLPVCIADLSYYQLKMDWMGFGSGSYSIIDGRIKGFTGGTLRNYIANPTKFDFDQAIPDGSETLMNLISLALTTPEGAEAAIFQERTGMSLADACEYPDVKKYLGQLAEHGRMISDDNGLHFVREDIANVFISMNWIEKPAQAVPVELGMPTVSAA